MVRWESVVSIIFVLLFCCFALELIPEAAVSARPDPLTALEIRRSFNHGNTFKLFLRLVNLDMLCLRRRAVVRGQHQNVSYM